MSKAGKPEKKTPPASPAPSPSQLQTVCAMLAQDLFKEWQVNLQTALTMGLAQVQNGLAQLIEQGR